MKEDEYNYKLQLLEREHEYKLEQLEFVRKTEAIKHDYAMQQIRLKSARMEHMEQLRLHSRGKGR